MHREGGALAGLLRAGNAGSNTTADHITLLGQALRSLPPQYRPDPADPDAPQILIRSDLAGATYGFAAACRHAGVGFSLGAVIDARVRQAAEVFTATNGWYPAIEADGGIREAAWVAEATDLVELSNWPAGHPADPAQGTTPSRPPTDVHRLRRAPGHRVSHRHRTPVWSMASWPAWNDVTANTPASKTASAKPKPPDYVTCRFIPLTPMPPGSKSS
jgi:hypothetical protein